MSAAATALLASLLAGASGTPGPASLADAATRSFALIVAVNASLDDDIRPLRYADDDGLRYARLFSAAGAQVHLLSVLDDETQRLHPDLVAQAAAPSRAELDGRLDRLWAAITAANRAGEKTVLYFVYVGHGRIGPNRQGYVNLLDQRFDASALYERVVSASPASFNHIVIDACHAYYMVAARGDGASEWRDDRSGYDFSALIERLSPASWLERHPNTGVLLSTSGAAEAQEWSGFGAGVFTYEVISGLLGGADVNRDGRIEYSELEAFVAAANLALRSPRARQAIFSHPPALDRRQPLLDLRQLQPAGYLRLDRRSAGHYMLEDAEGMRYADLHKEPGSEVYLALLRGPWFWLRSGSRETRLQLEAERRIYEPADDGWKPVALASRGSLGDVLARDLFARPFGPAFYQGYAASAGTLAVGLDAPAWTPWPAALQVAAPPPPALRPWGWAALGLGVAAGAGAGVSAWLNGQAYAQYERRFIEEGLRDEALARRFDRTRALTWVGTGLSAAGLLAGVTILLFDPAGPQPSGAATPPGTLAPGPAFSLSLGPASLQLTGWW